MLDITGIDNEDEALAGYEVTLEVANKIPTEKSRPARTLQLPIHRRYTQRKLTQEDGAYCFVILHVGVDKGRWGC